MYLFVRWGFSEIFESGYLASSTSSKIVGDSSSESMTEMMNIKKKILDYMEKRRKGGKEKNKVRWSQYTKTGETNRPSSMNENIVKKKEPISLITEKPEDGASDNG